MNHVLIPCKDKSFIFVCVSVHPNSVASTSPYTISMELWRALALGVKQLAVLATYPSSAGFKDRQRCSFAASYPFMMCAETTVLMFINVVLNCCWIFHNNF